jgi:hypothetical protein
MVFAKRFLLNPRPFYKIISASCAKLFHPRRQPDIERGHCGAHSFLTRSIRENGSGFLRSLLDEMSGLVQQEARFTGSEDVFHKAHASSRRRGNDLCQSKVVMRKCAA